MTDEGFLIAFLVVVIGIAIFAAIRGGRQAILGSDDVPEIGEEEEGNS